MASATRGVDDVLAITGAGLVGLPTFAADAVSNATGSNNLTQILTVTITGVVASVGAYLAWDTERRRRRDESRKPQGWQDMRDTINDLRKERDELKAELREEREERDRADERAQEKE